MSMQSIGSQSAGNGDVSSNHVVSGFGPDDIISDDEDVVMEEMEDQQQQPQLRAGVFSKFRSVCQTVFQSLIGGKQQQQQQQRAPVSENTTRIIRRRSRQTLVTAEMQRKASELSVLNHMQPGNLPTTSQFNSNSLSIGTVVTNNGKPSSNNLLLAAAAANNANSSEIGSRLAVPIKRGYNDAPPSSMPASTPFKADVANQSFTAPWSALKQRRLEETSNRPIETSTFNQPPAVTLRAAPIIETTSLHQTIRESDRYSSMTLPSSHLHRPSSREFGSALSGETSSLTTPLGAKRRVSLFETKTMTPHFNVEKMEPVPYHTLDRFPARSSPLVGLSPRLQSPLAPRVVRLDVSTSKPSPHSPLVRAPLSVPTVVNPTAQRLAKAYQQLTSATVSTKPQMTPVDPTRVHLIDPAQYFSRPKTETAEAAPLSKIEPIIVRPVEPQVSITTQQKPAFRFAPSTTLAASREPIETGKVVTNGQKPPGKFLLTAPSVLIDTTTGGGSVSSIWTCSDCDIANSITNEYCFSCGRSKVSSSKKALEVDVELKPQVAPEQPEIKRQRQVELAPHPQQEQKPPVIAPPTAETSRVLGGGPSATSTPFIMSAKEPSATTVGPSKPSVPSGGVIGQWRCSNCLFMNDFKAISCTRCTRSSTTTTVSVNGVTSTTSEAVSSGGQISSATPAAGASSRLKRRATLEGGWMCGCMHMNPRSAAVCDLCNAPKPQPVISAPPKTTAGEVMPKPVNGLPAIAPASKFELPPISLPATTESVRLSTATATTTSLTAPIPTPVPIFGTGTTETAKPAEQKLPLATTAAISVPSTSTTATLAAPLSSTGFGSQFSVKEGQWTCNVCMIRNDKDKAKCAACDSPNPNAPKTAAPPAETPKFGVLAGGTGASNGGAGFSFAFSGTAAAKPADSATPATTISFGVPPTISTTTTSAPAMGGFKFGMTTSPVAAGTAAPSTATSTAAPAGFTFGSLAAPKPVTTSAPSGPGGFGFTFGATSGAPAVTTTAAAPTTATTSAAAPVFGASAFGTPVPATTAPTTTTAQSLFGASSTAATTTAPSSTSMFGMPPATTSAPSLFGMPSSTTGTSIPSFGGAFGAPQTTTQATGGFFGTTSTTNAPLFGNVPASTAATTAPTTASAFAFGTTAAAPPTTTSAAPTSGFTFGTASTAPTSSFTFGSTATSTAPSTAAPSSGFVFGSGASTTAPAPATTAPFSFGSSTTAATTAAPFSFGTSQQPASTTAPPQTNGPTSLFGFGASAPATGGGSATTTSVAPFTFGALAQPTSTATSTSGSASAFNFASSVPSAGTTTNGTSGGFKFETSAPAFNFSAGNPPAGPVTATPQPPAFIFNAGGGGFSPAQTTPCADGPMLFSSGASAVVQRPKAAAVRKLKVVGRK